MDPQLCPRVREVTPKMNSLVARNIVVDKIRDVERYVERLWRNSKDSLPEDLKFQGLRRCTAKEQFRYLCSSGTNKQGTKMVFDLAPSDVFMTMLEFRWYGALEPGAKYEPGKDYIVLRHPILLPVVGQGGKMQIRGANFIISPVLADPVISYTKDMAFVMLPRDKITVRRLPFHFASNDSFDSFKMHYLSLPWAQMYHIPKPNKLNGDSINHHAETTLGHYLFAKYGVTESFKLFADAECVIGRNLLEKDYPKENWVIYRSSGVVPKGFSTSRTGKSKTGLRYQRPDINIAVKRGGMERLVHGLVGSFIYLVDRYYDRFPVDYDVTEFADDPRHWRTLLGLIIFNNNNGDAKLLRDINNHIHSLDRYVDEIQQKKFKQAGIPCDDIYEFMAYLIDNAAVEMARVDTTSMFGKELMVLDYVMEDIRKNIFKLGFNLITLERSKKQNNRRKMTNDEVLKYIRRQVATEAILSIQAGGDKREKVATSIGFPGDCMLFKVTSHVVLQSQNAGGASLKDESRLINASIPIFGSYLNLPKSEPTGRQKFSSFAPVDENGRLLEDPAVMDDYYATQEQLKKDVGRFDEEVIELGDNDVNE